MVGYGKNTENASNMWLSAYDNIGLPLYIADIETNEILFLNKAAILFLGNVLGQKCHSAVCGFTAPCPDCICCKDLKANGEYSLAKNRYSPHMDRYFDAYECKVDWLDGVGNKAARLCMLVDVTEEYRLKKQNEEKDSLLGLQSAFITSAKTMLGAMALDGHLMFINKAMADAVGRSMEEIIELGLACVHPEASYQKILHECMPVMKSGKEWKGETSIVTKDGVIIPTRQTGFPIRNEVGEIIAFATIIEDISEEKRMETMYQWQLAIMECSKDYFSVADMDKKVIYNSPGAYRMMGYDQADFQDGLLIESVHSEAYSNTVRDVGIPTAIEKGIWVGNGDLKRRDGCTIPIEQTIFPVTSKKNEIIGVATIIRDIREKKESERLINQAQHMLRSIIDTNPSGIFWKDRNSVFLGCNMKFAHDAKLESPDELIGKNDYDFYTKEIAEAYRENDRKIFESGQDILYFEEPFQAINGETRWVSTSKILIKDANNVPTILLGVYDDVTDRKRNEEKLEKAIHEAEEANHAKSDFLSRMSHEIRTPMNAIIGMTKIGQTTDNPEKMKYCLGKVSDASKQLLGIINDILDMSKIEANKLELIWEPFNLEKLLETVCSVNAVKAEEKKINLLVHLDPSVPCNLIGDELRLSQVLSNLLSNATKFTPEYGSVQLNIRQVPRMDDQCELNVEVIDTGIGISEEQLPKLFRSFEQAEGSISRRFGGTGLGLAISKRIVNLMGGNISVSSEIGKGSRFSFNVLLRQNNRIIHKEYDISIYRNFRILLISSDGAIIDYFRRVMAEFGIECDIAVRLEDAREVARLSARDGKPYDIYFVDGQLLHAPQLVHGQNSKVVVMIDSTAEETPWYQAGASLVIHKPLFQSTMLNAVNNLLISKEMLEGFESAVSASIPQSLKGYKMLLAEDIDINREIAITLLENTGIDIDCAEDGEEAVQMFFENQDRYDIILMDVQMPNLDGLEATRRIRALGTQQAKDIPIVAMTANAFKEDIEVCTAAGMVDHISKPIDVDELVQKVTKYTRRHSSHRSMPN